MDRAVDAVNQGAATLAGAAGDLSLWGLFLQADIVVKLVMVGLLAASVWVWAVVFEKWSSLRKANRDADEFEDRFWSGGSLEELYDEEGTRPTHPMAAVFGAAMGEWRRSARAEAGRSSVRERVDRAIAVTVNREMDRLERWMVFLASVGATAPFVGLFGTVWGIYHALTAIGIAGQASIDKVAGPVGEALIMTAIGLAVAVPAVLGYNWLIRRNKAAMDRVRGFAADLHAVLLSAAASPAASSASPARTAAAVASA
jgi:biopolymer transport protein TolQ